MIGEPKEILRNMFSAALSVADPEQCVPPHLPVRPVGRTIVIGAGKASAAMAKAVEASWSGAIEGLVVTRYGHGAACNRIEIVEASHPVPDEAGRDAARRMLDMVSDLSEDDLVLCLISGGGSALLALPAPGLTLEDKQAVTNALLRSGATIQEINCVRKHLSAIKGGRLAVACAPATVLSLVISDVAGDDLTAIASGPTVGDPTSFADALSVLGKYHIDQPAAVIEHLKAAADETPLPGDPRLAKTETRIIAAPQRSLLAAADVAKQAGIDPIILSDSIEGEARDVALVHAAIAQQVAHHGQPGRAPAVLLSGGETTVTVRGKGRGGRNAEFLLALAVALDGLAGVYAIACDTDGIDGTENNAGAILAPNSVSRAAALGLNARSYLDDNNGYMFFSLLGDLVITGPTLTNVNDFRAILVVDANGLGSGPADS